MVGTNTCLSYVLIIILKFHTGAVPLHYWFRSVNAKLPIWLGDVSCIGSESSLLNCTHDTVGEISTFCDHYDDVGVRCSGESTYNSGFC